ncbi:hypothetical protein CAPTEDRAFT_186052 [Capitella teleta]|uniref:G-protein coupled receptors family 1 profile domain-containing protein n=1 Tax=Capitella teleta TaxID=283909 RepID=R7UEX4_CAPTE|nr:hypothetical protein CAPTEDRAFT_186052 [Capitella teleta]|eukprot:ELU04765.1 hypothetical protein CAPTEDRAFT_186052 [Capitella teleta]
MDSTTTGDSTSTRASAYRFTRECSLYFYVVGTLVGGSLILIGLLGNCISLTILGKERKKSSTIQALCLLAVADICLLFAYSLFPLMETPWVRKTNSIGIFAGVYYMFEVARICNQVSASLTMILTWQRYVAVCLPHKAKHLCTVRIVNWISACSAVASVAFYLPNFFMYSVKIRDDGFMYWVSNSIVHNEYFQMIYSVILTYLVSYIIPVASLLYMSVAILRSLKSQSNTIASSTNSQHARNDLTKSSFAIVIIYVLCQSLQPIRRILMWVYDPYTRHLSCGGKLFQFSFMPHLALMLNSSANFAIYILFARGFRRKLIVFLTRRNDVGPNDSSDSSTKPSPSIHSVIVPAGISPHETSAIAAADKNMKFPDTMAPPGAVTVVTNNMVHSGNTPNIICGAGLNDTSDNIQLE